MTFYALHPHPCVINLSRCPSAHRAQMSLRTGQHYTRPHPIHEVPSVFQVCQPLMQVAVLPLDSRPLAPLEPLPLSQDPHSMAGSRCGWDEENMGLSG